MADRQLPLVEHLQHHFGQFQQPERIGDRRTVTTNGVSYVLLRELEFSDEAFVTASLVDRRQIVALQVLDQRQRQQRAIIGVALYGGGALPAELLAGAEPAFAGDQLERPLAARRLPHDDRLQQSRLFYRRGELLQCCRVDGLAPRELVPP